MWVGLIQIASTVFSQTVMNKSYERQHYISINFLTLWIIHNMGTLVQYSIRETTLIVNFEIILYYIMLYFGPVAFVYNKQLVSCILYPCSILEADAVPWMSTSETCGHSLILKPLQYPVGSLQYHVPHPLTPALL